ncbi:MAG: OmpA family protein [Rehaibacterium terrae]|uniref:OmpA family protein n=1 Tax=Rehaibacterium terrae TaxID=1341696 RepID=UPI00391A2FFD
MKKKLLCCALLGALGAAQAVVAQDYDDRWYVSAATGFTSFDKDRNVGDKAHAMIGLGKFLSQDWSVDLELSHSNPRKDGTHLNWSLAGAQLVARRHFRDADSTWWPYVAAGVGVMRKWEEFDAFPNPNSPGERKENNLMASLGGGLQASYGRVNIRTELGVRFDFDDRSVGAPSESHFSDWIASIGVTIPLGAPPAKPVEPEPVAPPPPPPPPVQYCPDGSVMGPDGCPVPLTIDLRGVNFDFDRATLRPDAIAILNEAIEILKKYPDLRVEVAGHTDLCGPESYNQRLSESRARAVYEYLTSNGISASRLVGPVGYGESRPLEPTPQTFPACKSETNRRTELNVQN